MAAPMAACCAAMPRAPGRWALGARRAPRAARARARALGPAPSAAALQAKEELLKSLEGIDRGAAASEEQAANVDALAAALEALNPTDDPLSSARLNGQWELLYTTSASILGTSKPKWLRPWGKILQALDAGSLRAENLEGAPLFNAVRAKLTPRGADDIVDVQFDTFRLAGFLKVKAPERARGWLKITYLDDDLRVCRGDKGNLFVLSMHERDYSLPAEGW